MGQYDVIRDGRFLIFSNIRVVLGHVDDLIELLNTIMPSG
jgi:hypothetical protein